MKILQRERHWTNPDDSSAAYAAPNPYHFFPGVLARSARTPGYPLVAADAAADGDDITISNGFDAMGDALFERIVRRYKKIFVELVSQRLE